MANDQLSADSAVYQCKSCEGLLPLSGFYVSNQTQCKECIKAKVRANRKAKLDYYRAYDRKRYRDSDERKEVARKSARSEAGLASKARCIARSRAENPEKFRARNAVSKAIKSGKLARGTECHFCGGSNHLQAHHKDYDLPLDVVWLCAGCHGKLHAINGDFRREDRA